MSSCSLTSCSGILLVLKSTNPATSHQAATSSHNAWLNRFSIDCKARVESQQWLIKASGVAAWITDVAVLSNPHSIWWLSDKLVTFLCLWSQDACA